jgi:hypothetical protein
MRFAIFAAAAFVVTACNPAPSTTSEGEAASAGGELSLICEAFAHVSYDALAAAYGADNLSEQTLPGPEGETYTATVLYPGDTTRRLEIVWSDAAKTAPASVNVSGEGSLWRGPNNIAIGDDLARVEAANGRPFTLWGFGWDYGGWVSDWKGGQLGDSNNCRVSAHFNAAGGTEGVSGDSEFASDLPAMRAANPTVSAFGLMFSPPAQ